MDLDDAAVGQTSHLIVTPGEAITTEVGYLRGHGTYVDGAELVASVAGSVERVNKLVSVRPLNARYTAEIGDVVVGRITEVGTRRWKVDLNSRQDGVLMLSSINLSGGVQRRRTYADQLQMRSFFEENDLISADVHSIYADGAIALHARSLKYGKLENGMFVSVPPSLMKRLKQHFVSLPCGVDVILGNNGYIWITESMDEEKADFVDSTAASKLEERRKRAAERFIGADARRRMAHVRNAITKLREKSLPITPESIMTIYAALVDAAASSESLAPVISAPESATVAVPLGGVASAGAGAGAA